MEAAYPVPTSANRAALRRAELPLRNQRIADSIFCARARGLRIRVAPLLRLPSRIPSAREDLL